MRRRQNLLIIFVTLYSENEVRRRMTVGGRIGGKGWKGGEGIEGSRGRGRQGGRDEKGGREG